MSIEPRHPFVNVAGLLNAVGRQVAAAFAVTARIGQKNSIAVVEEESSKSGHAFAIVRDPVQQDDCVAVEIARVHIPSPEYCAVRRGDGDFLKNCSIVLPDEIGSFNPMLNWAAIQLQAGFGDTDAGRRRKKQV